MKRIDPYFAISPCVKGRSEINIEINPFILKLELDIAKFIPVSKEGKAAAVSERIIKISNCSKLHFIAT